MRDNVARIRQLLDEAVQQKQLDTDETRARREFEVYEFNVGLPVVDPSPRARMERHIGRIASWFAWGAPEVVRQLDAHCASSLAELGDREVDQLLVRMKWLEECAREGFDSPDAPPAR